MRVQVHVRRPPLSEPHLQPLPVAHVVAHGDVPADAEWAHAEAQADVLAVVIRAEHVELDVHRVARVAVLGHDGVRAHLTTDHCIAIGGQNSNVYVDRPTLRQHLLS